MIVEFSAAAAGTFHDGFRLTVDHRQQRKKRMMNSIVSPCGHHIDADAHDDTKQGYIYSPAHWYAKNTHGTGTLDGSKSRQPIWLEIRLKSSRHHAAKSGHHPNNNISNCQHRIEIVEGGDGNTSLTVCERDRKRIHFYLSTNGSVAVRFVSTTGSLDGSEMNFDVFYMFISSEGDQSLIAGTVCDHLVTGRRGSLRLIANRLALRQRKQLTCRYEIRAAPEERIRIDVRSVKFDPIRQCDERVDAVQCSRSDGAEFDQLIVSDRDDVLLDCICRSAGGGDSLSGRTLYTTSNVAHVRLNLNRIFSESYKDDDIYDFRLEYEAVEMRCGRQMTQGQQGSIDCDADSLHDGPCPWLIKMPPNDRILFKINGPIDDDVMGSGGGGGGEENCTDNRLLIRYFGHGLYGEHDFCAGSMLSEFVSPFATEFAHIELKSTTTALKRSSFHLHWNVLHSSLSVADSLCHFQCPNSSWCLLQQMVCDGRIDCPQNSLHGYLLDEERSLCRDRSASGGHDGDDGNLGQFNRWFFIAAVALIVSAVLAFIIANVWIVRKQSERKLAIK